MIVVKGIETIDTLAISHIGTGGIMFQVVRPDRFNIIVTGCCGEEKGTPI